MNDASYGSFSFDQKKFMEILSIPNDNPVQVAQTKVKEDSKE